MMKNLFSLFSIIILVSCSGSKNVSGDPGKGFDFEGHRGGRGLMPENTIPAMYRGIDEGVTTLEMDLQITKDKKVVVSHDPFFNELITTSPEGAYLTKAEARKRLLFHMDYDSIRKYDVGMKPHPDFPQQQKIPAVKPLFADLLDSTELYAKAKGRSLQYNVEIKSKQATDNINHPQIPEFVELVINVLQDKKVTDRTIIQSFDQRPLVYLHEHYPGVKTSLLLEATNTSAVEDLVKQLGFTPTVISPHQSLVTKTFVEDCHRHHIQVIPWTVNTVPAMKKLMQLGVDGLISDYPNLYKQL